MVCAGAGDGAAGAGPAGLYRLRPDGAPVTPGVELADHSGAVRRHGDQQGPHAGQSDVRAPQQIISIILSLITIIFFFQPFKNISLPQNLIFLKNPGFTPLGNQLDLAIFLGFFVYIQNAKKLTHKMFALFCLAVAIWSYAYFLWQTSTTASTALLWSHILMAGAIFIPVSYLQLVYLVVNLFDKIIKLVINKLTCSPNSLINGGNHDW